MKWKRGRGGERDGERKENARREERQRVGGQWMGERMLEGDVEARS